MASPLETRIKNVQKSLKVAQTGVFDLATCRSFEMLRNIVVGNRNDENVHRKEIQKALGFTGKDVDGIFGVGTLSRIELIFDRNLPALPAGASMIVSKKGIDIIIESEVSSKIIYNKKYKSPTWPKVDSGVTIGIGYDLGQVNASSIVQDWKDYLSPGDVKMLVSVSGLKKDKANEAIKNNLNNINSVIISWEAALTVFYSRSLPNYARKTKASYPDIAALPPDAQAAVVSLVYNRGNGLKDEPGKDRRLEMRSIVSLIAAKDLKGIAAQFRSMKRLWNAASSGGLITRREREAVLVENASYVMSPDEYIFI